MKKKKAKLTKTKFEEYRSFLTSKTKNSNDRGFKPLVIPDYLFDFQKMLTEWCIIKGSAAIFADCGLGKTIISLIWAENIVKKTNKPVLILTPLAVSPQFISEGNKFGVECKVTQHGQVHKGINITNYQRLHNFNPKDFAGIACDESGILKCFDGKLRTQITIAMNSVKYRFLGSATPAPNDYMELGSSSEALGIMTRTQMLAMFFVNDGKVSQKWNLKDYGKTAFWKWMALWARAIRKPSDFGFKNGNFILPDLSISKHTIHSSNNNNGTFGLFGGKTLQELRSARSVTLQERCEFVASIIPSKNPFLIWCHYNSESDLLAKIIPEAVQVKGSDRDDLKEQRLLGFSKGDIRILITKPTIAGFGLNWQHCSNMSYFPSYSYEQWYQAIRRCWRFGQKNNVNVNLVACQAEAQVVSAMQRKEKQCIEMFKGLVREMQPYQLAKKIQTNQVNVKVPKWLK